jgi:hypothetical protein
MDKGLREERWSQLSFPLPPESLGKQKEERMLPLSRLKFLFCMIVILGNEAPNFICVFFCVRLCICQEKRLSGLVVSLGASPGRINGRTSTSRESGEGKPGKRRRHVHGLETPEEGGLRNMRQHCGGCGGTSTHFAFASRSWGKNTGCC